MSEAPDRNNSSFSEDQEDFGADCGNNARNLFKSGLMGPLGAIQTIQDLPPPVKRRVKALKKLQVTTLNIEAKYFEEIHALEMKYHELYKDQYTKRSQIIRGAYEPNDEECDFESDREDEDEVLPKDINKKLNIKEIQAENEANDAKGIPDFWLTIFRNVSLLQEMAEEHDVPILKHLQDITVDFKSEPMGFVLNFHFSPNEFFTNSVLTKEYEMKCMPEPGAPFEFEGPEIIRCKGCPIDWVKGKNVTTKTIKKKQKHKGRGEVRTVTKTVRRDSFFNFFEPPPTSEDPDAEVDDEVQTLLTADFEIGHYIRERIVPRAVLYFTGEALDEEDDDYEEDDEDEEDEDKDDDGEEDDDDDDDNVPSKNKKVNTAECPQQ